MNTAGSPKAEGADASGFAPSWYAPADLDAVPHGHDGPPPAGDDDPVSPRLWRLLMGARLFVATALLVLQTTAWWHGNAPGWIVGLCAALALISATAFALPRVPARGGPGAPRWLLTVWADLGVFATLQVFAPGSLNFMPLFVWPVLLAAVIGPRLLALGCAAAGTLALLVAAWHDSRGTLGTAEWLQAGVTGSGLFIVALLASHLTTRLVGEQAAARRSRRLADLHSQINRLIATGLGEGIVVMDTRGAIWYANPAAARMVGADPPLDGDEADAGGRLRQTPAWPPLAGWARGALRGLGATPPRDRTVLAHDLTLPLPGGRHRRVRVRLCPLGSAEQPAAVLFLEDLHDIELRVRTEKLAAMGRVSAAVAHEIRNPLAAIAQASALLQEDEASPAQRHLIGLIEQNVRRLSRTVEDVLETARTPWHDTQAPAPSLDLDTAVDDILADWLRQRPQGARLQRHADAGRARIAFDPEHLRRVLVNLLDNADRHASHASGAIRVATVTDGQHVRLVVWSDGPDIPTPVRDHLFEPFASTYSRSSGLGLYLSRELCQRYHADLGHERVVRDGREGNAFVVRLPATDAIP